MEFKNLVHPVLEFTASEFGLNRLLTANLGVNLEALPPVNTDLASGDCQIRQTVFAQSEKIEIPPEKLFDHLSYSHFLLIMNVENPLGRVFYELETMKGVWSFRELKRQIDSNYFERTALSKNPAKMSAIVQSRIAQTGHSPALKDLVKSPYVYEFIGLNNKDVVEESDLENALMSHLEEFLLELGNGFCFETRQKRILVDDDYFFCDLVFYHRILKCHVLIDLKAAKIKYDDIAQMNLYLAYYRKNVMEKGDNPPVGILMCTKAGKELVEYATAGIEESLFVQKYKLSLPAKDELTRWLKKEVNDNRDTSK
jgi:predicted nuclease of restriction endonuclease-like (RecB) superfamily